MGVGKKGEIDSLTGIRAFAAAWVVLFHCMSPGQTTSHLWWLNNLAARGGSAVDLFFVLSGFIMAYVYREKMMPFSFRETGIFLWRRFARIYPAHFTVLLLILLLYSLAVFLGTPFTEEYYTAPKFLYQLFMLNGLGIPDSAGWNHPSWTISSEFFAYLTFPFIIVWTSRLNARQSILAIASIFLTMFALAFLVNGGKSYYMPWAFVLTRIGSQFPVGSLLYNLVSLPQIKRIASWLAAITLILIVAVSILLTHDMVFGAFSVLFAVLVLAAATDHSSVLNTFLSSRIMVFLGNISYSLYIVHFFTGIILSQTVKSISVLQEHIPRGSFNWFVSSLALAIIAGAILHFWVEVPARRWLTVHGSEISFWKKPRG
jgi:peptidoglycan/LPS O-acetylase OafA/YrhL